MRKLISVFAGAAAVAAGLYLISVGNNPEPANGGVLSGLSDGVPSVDDDSATQFTVPVIASARTAQSSEDVANTATGPMRNAAETQRSSYGVVEGGFLTGDMLNDHATDVLGSKSFDNVATDLQREARAGNPDLQAAYRIQIEDSLEPYARVAQLTRFECGTNVCMGSIRTADAKWSDQWTIGLHEQATLPMPTFSRRTLTLAPQNQEIRFLFTTKPGPGGFTSKRPASAG